MSFFNSVLQDDARFAFAGGDFGESVVYTKKSGTTRTINAVVDRFPPQIGEGGMTAPSFIITVTNDSTSGISSSEVDYGGDTITVAQRIGGEAKAYKFKQPADGQADQDHGMLRVELI